MYLTQLLSVQGKGPQAPPRHSITYPVGFYPRSPWLLDRILRAGKSSAPEELDIMGRLWNAPGGEARVGDPANVRTGEQG